MSLSIAPFHPSATIGGGTALAAPGRAGAARPASAQDMLTLSSGTPTEPSALGRANRRGFETFADWNDKVGGVVGGALGLGVVIPALYVGVIGGAIAGGIAGLGFGPANAVLQGAHGLSFLGTILSTGGTVAKAATIIGTATGTVGGFVVGQKVGRTLGAVPIFAAAYPVGFAKGLVSKDDPYQDPNPPQQPDKPAEPKKHERPGSIQKTAQGLLGGAGLITGAIGGAVVGAGIGSGAALTTGLIATNLTWSALGAGAMFGAIGGGVLFAGLCGFGGYAIATGVSGAVNWAKDKVFPDKEKVALEQKRADVAKKQTDFEQLGSGVAQHSADAKQYVADTEKALEKARSEANTYIDGKEAEVTAATREADGYIQAAEDKLNARQGQITAQDGKVEGQINGKADAIFGEIRKPTDEKYAGLQQGLDTKENGLKTRDAQVSANEKAQAEIIERKTVAAYDEKMKPVNAHYDELNGQQTQREGKLNTWEGQIAAGNQALDQQIATDGKKDYDSREPALENTYRGKEADLRTDYQQRTAQADSQAQSDLTALGQKHDSDTRDLDNRYGALTSSATMQAGQLQSQSSQLQSDVSRLQSDYQRAQYDERNAENELSNAQSQRQSVLGQAERERDQAVGERDRASSELNSVQNDLSSAQSDRNNYINQKAQVDGQIPGLRAERDRLQHEVDNRPHK